MNAIRLILLLAVLSIANSKAFAQRQKLQVLVKDSADGKAIPKATVVILAKKDSALLEFGITDSLGKYLFKSINTEKSGALVVSMTGYLDLKISLNNYLTTKNNKDEILVQANLTPHFAELDNVIVSGNASPIRMNKDTLEFNADMFKSQPNAVLEDLLRKLPGVEIRNGKEVYVNGQRVGKILIEGKEFFGSDPVVILKNLPADIIAKVQVADEKNTVKKDLRLQKDIPKTINLRLKKEFKSGTFGKFFAGYGSLNRFETGGLLNTFRDTLQVSFIGSSNNQGRSSFSWEDLDEYAGFGRSAGLGGQDGGDLMYGNRDEGIATKTLAGFNANYNIGKDVQINGQYFFNQSSQRTSSEDLSQQFLGDSVLLASSLYGGTTLENTHKASTGLKWKQDSTGYLTVIVNAEFNNKSEDASGGSQTYSKNAPLLSDSYFSQLNSNSGNKFSASADYEKTYVKSKIDWSVKGSYSQGNGRDYSATDNRYLRIINNFLPDSLRQIRDIRSPNRELNFNTGINKTWHDRNTISLSLELANRDELIGGDTYQFSKVKNENLLVPSLSVKLMLQKQRMANVLSYKYGYKDLSIQTSLSYRTLLMKNRYNYDSIPELNRSYSQFSPSVNINYKSFGFSFNRNFQEPYASALKPVTDSSNPLYVFIGNPELRPGILNSFSLQYYKYFERIKLNISGSGNMQIQKDALGNSREVFSDGKTVQSYVNFDQSRSYDGYISINKSYNKNHWNYNYGFSGSVNLNEAPLLLNKSIVNIGTTWLYASVNFHIGYDSKYWLRGGYMINMSHTSSDDPKIPASTTKSNRYSTALHVQVLKKLTWDGNLNYTVNPGTAAGYKKDWVFCDMAVTYSMLKKDRMQIKLSAFDIFNQNLGQFRYTYQNFVADNRSLVQKQYFMTTVFYTLRKL